ncbi:HAMP domain protein, partial [Mycena olivaceomarginata]
QIHNVSRVCSALAVGDLTRRVTVPVQDEGIVKLKEITNTMTDTFGRFSTELTRVVVDLSTRKLGSRTLVDGAQGTWYDLTQNVSSGLCCRRTDQLTDNQTMSSILTAQMRTIARATTAIANGDLSVRVDVHAGGEMLDLKETVTEMAMRAACGSGTLRARSQLEVGTEGRMGGQAVVHSARGTRGDLTEKINACLASPLYSIIRSIGIVIREVALGNFGWMVDAHMSGEMGDIKDTLNGMVGRLQTFSSEVNRLALEVGTEGGLRRPAVVPGAQGAWGDLTENLNIMTSNLTNQVRSIAHVSAAVARGDLSKRMDIDVSGEMLDLKCTINEMVQRLDIFSREATLVVREVGTEGKLGGEVEAEGMEGTWRDLTDNINRIARNLRDQVRTIAVVTKGISQGDLGMTIPLKMRGEMGDLKDTINTMVAQFHNFSSEVTRLALEVGTYGLLGGHAEVPGALGTWKDLTYTLNAHAQRMTANLTNQVRSISYVVMVTARGDLTKAIIVDAHGEMQDLKVNVQEVVARLSNSSREGVVSPCFAELRPHALILNGVVISR